MNKLEVKNILKDNKLPEGWKITNLIDTNYFKIVGSGIEFFKGNKNYLSTNSVQKTRITHIEENITYFNRPSRANIQPTKNRIAFAKMRNSIKVLYINEKLERDYILSTGFSLFEVKIYPKYFYQYIMSCFFNHQKDLLAEGTTQEAISNDDFKGIYISFPPSAIEQQKIAEILETVDQTIGKTDAIIEKYKRIKQGLMQDLFTKGITAFEFEKDKLVAAVKKVFDSGDHRFGREENLVSHLSRYLNEFFPGWDIDSEVEKNDERQRPDIIVHKRGTDNNLFAIEIKKNDNLNAIKEDIKKLENVMLGDYHYEDAIFVGFNIENSKEIFKLSDRINYILVSQNGEIKVKPCVRKFKDSLLGRIQEVWEVSQIADIADVTKLAGFEFSKYFRYIDDGEIIALRALNIKNRKLDLSDIQRIKKEVYVKLPRSQVNAGDILITYIGAYIGDTLLIKESNKYHLGPNIAKITTKKYILPEFLEFFLLSDFAKSQYKQLSTLTATPSLTMAQIRRIIIFFPKVKEQCRITSILSQIDETIEKEQKYREKLERIKQGLMEDLLTGEVRTNYLIKEGVESV
jgi:restriction endonuclease S subunit